ncbi:hypothetical protein H5410_048475 [Solanum commersonii]|uniref:Uncharacterized protein n=1 Tax=Solanum commersonii TaxID=4109 RepID=A0A9J5XI71_SOLCO|nr:hypothetical protein H5410_048475 [Solanum commersonii]
MLRRSIWASQNTWHSWSGFKRYQAANNSNVAVLMYAMVTQITDEYIGTLGRVSGEEDKHTMMFKAP